MLSVVGALFLGSFVGSSSAVAAPEVPAHNVVCRYQAYTPSQFVSHGDITFGAHITCTPGPPDVSNTTVILWRRSGSQYTNVAHLTSNRLSSDWYLNGVEYCSGHGAGTL